MINNIFDKMEIQRLLCSHTKFSHEARFLYFKDSLKEVNLSIYLNRLGFWKRLWLAVKYIFNKNCAYGNVAEIVLNVHEVESLRRYLDVYLSKVHLEEQK